MRIILTGATGFAGGATLEKLERDACVTAITCVTRRPPASTSRKLTVMLQSDFTQWPGTTLDLLATHDAMLWTMGAKESDYKDPKDYENVTVHATLRCALGIAQRLQQPFQLCFLSGMGADPTETSTFPWQRLTRHMKGRAEAGLKELTQSFPHFHATSFRPGGILPARTPAVFNAMLAPLAVKVDRLAECMLHRAGQKKSRPYLVLSNRDIRHC